MLKRKMLDKLIAWKQKAGGREALLIEGARRVGKSTIVEEFGRTQYKSYILIDFTRLPRDVRDIFENQRDDFDTFLSLIKESGDSSYKRLQNIYSNHDFQNQPVSIGIAISENVLENNGVCRVHGGGFAGTIQAFVKTDFVPEYKKATESIFGEGACHVLKIRKYGGVKVL